MKIFNIFKTFILNILNTKSDSVHYQFIRYFISSLAALIVDYCIYFILTRYFNIYYVYSNIISRIFGIFVNYTINTTWVFNEKRFDNGIRERIIGFIIFIGIGFLGVGVNTFFIWLFTEVFKIFDIISKVISTLISYLFNFGIRKIILFSKKESK